MRKESTPGPVMSREWFGWGGFPCSVIQAKTAMFMAVKNTQELASRRVATYSDEPAKFDALGPFRPQAIVPVCTQEAAFLMVRALLPLLNMIY